ncbi:MAG TPA: glutaminyl-peptide cyclotransferase [Terracidiphilus sp.]
MRLPFSCLALSIMWIAVCASAPAQPPVHGYTVIHTFPHDPHAFTQGLIYEDGHLYESTGQYGESSLRMVDLETGRVLQKQPVAKEYFAEGLASWGSTLIQLTWQEQTAFVYDRFSFRQLRTFRYPGEGWGLTSDGKQLILSDGTPELRFLDPATFHELRRVTVKDHGLPVDNLNELEMVRGEIYANVWHSDKIARISPRTGAVLGWIDLTGLLPANLRSSSEAVLNGIAYDAVHDRLFVTGKLWPRLYEIRVVPEVRKETHKKQ